jgi:putative toxin-antitoxin system antitoxin component (TIGR02293 family)
MPSRSHPAKRTSEVRREPVGSGGEGSIADERKRLAAAVLNGLPPRDRDVLLRFYLDELPQDRICAEMGLSETQFRLIKSRAMARFGELSRKAIPRKRPSVSTQALCSDFAATDIERVVPVVAHAVAVFGDEEKASHWLATPLALLGNRSPTQILAGGDTETIDQILTRIEYNIPS